jgi:hypothetical protein
MWALRMTFKHVSEANKHYFVLVDNLEVLACSGLIQLKTKPMTGARALPKGQLDTHHRGRCKIRRYDKYSLCALLSALLCPVPLPLRLSPNSRWTVFSGEHGYDGIVATKSQLEEAFQVTFSFGAVDCLLSVCLFLGEN